MIRNILWEVDGVLFDTHPAATYAVSRALNDLGLNLALNEIDGLMRNSLEHCLTTLGRRFKLDPVRLRLRFDESSLKIPPGRQPLLPGVREVCAFIQQRGLNIIVTDRNVEFVQPLLAAHALEKYFSGMICAAEGYACKPDPAMYRAAIERFGLIKTGTLVIASRDIDVRAGREAGLSTGLVVESRASEPADHHFDDYSGLLDWLRSQG